MIAFPHEQLVSRFDVVVNTKEFLNKNMYKKTSLVHVIGTCVHIDVHVHSMLTLIDRTV